MIRALEFYSGIGISSRASFVFPEKNIYQGGLHVALQRSGVSAKVVRAFDWDPVASQVYHENWGAGIVQRADIAQLTASQLSPFGASLWLLSPACQPYTVLNPSAKGAADPRARSFLHLVETVLPDLAAMGAHPRWILVENVAGFETSSTRQTLLSSLKHLGYNTEEFLLTPLQFSIPNSRLRYYLLAKLMPLTFADVAAGAPMCLRRCIPGCGTDWIDPRQHPDDDSTEHRCDDLFKFLDSPDDAQDPNYWQAFAVPDKILQKKGVLFDIVLPHSKRTCCFTRGYTHMAEGTSILQMNEALDTTATFNSYTASVSTLPAHTSDNPLQLLHALRLRYFTPDELLRLFHFQQTGHEQSHNPNIDFCWPTGISQKTKYRLIGNSVNVKVVQNLIIYLFQGDNVTRRISQQHTQNIA